MLRRSFLPSASPSTAIDSRKIFHRVSDHAGQGHMVFVQKRTYPRNSDPLLKIISGSPAGITYMISQYIWPKQILLYTLRLFGGRHPLWGIGVTSLIILTENPSIWRARKAASLPTPGPFTLTSAVFIPCSIA